jgi:hypothetical protein
MGLGQAPGYEEYLAQNILSGRLCIGIRRIYDFQSGLTSLRYVDVIETGSQPPDYSDRRGFTKLINKCGIYLGKVPDD